MRPLLFIVIALLVFFLTFCKSSQTCSTATDDQWYTLVDSLERTASVEEMDEVLKRLESKIRTPTLAYAYAQYRRGVIEHALKRPELAVQWYEKALETYCSCEDAPATRVAMLYKNLAAKYARELHQYNAGQEYALRGIEFLVEIVSADPALNDLYFELHVIAGEAEQRLGDGRAALRYYQLAENFSAEQPVSFYLRAQKFKSAAVAHKDLQELDQALAQINKAAEIILEQNGLIRADSADLADVYNDAGLIHLDRGEDARASRRIRQSIALNDALGVKTEYVMNLINYARILMNSGQLSMAKQQLDKALRLSKKEKSIEGEAACYKYIGEYYQHRQEYGNAMAAYSQSVDRYLGGSRLEDSQYRHYIFFPLKSKALLIHHNASGTVAEDDEVWQVYSELERLLQSLRQDFIDEDSKIFTQANIRPLYEGIIQRCYEGYAQSGDERWIHRALPYFEHSKSLVLQEGIQERQLLRQILSSEDFETYQTLQAKQLEAKRALQQAGNDPGLQQREAEASVLFDQYRKTLAEAYPQFRTYQATLDEPDLRSIQDDLRKSEQIIDFFVGQDATYILNIGPQSTQLIRRPFTSKYLAAKVEALRDQIQAGALPARQDRLEQYREMAAQAFQLYEDLLLPVLGVQNSDQRLLIVPDGVLAKLPFEVLLTTPVAEEAISDLPNYPYLINKTAISYHFSLTSPRKHQRNRPASVPLEVLGLAPSQAQKLSVEVGQGDAFTFAPLRYNEEELSGLPKVFRVDAWSGERANKERFLRAAGEYPILHFAGHGSADNQSASRTFLAFDLDNNEQNDELLFLPEIYTLRLPAEMVVLSACQTATGQLKTGEGVISLSRAATMAGAASVVSTLWVVNQQSKVGFVQRFYQALGEGASKDTALRAAKLHYLQANNGRWAHPYHWAGMILMGNPRSLLEAS